MSVLTQAEVKSKYRNPQCIKGREPPIQQYIIYNSIFKRKYDGVSSGGNEHNRVTNGPPEEWLSPQVVLGKFVIISIQLKD